LWLSRNARHSSVVSGVTSSKRAREETSAESLQSGVRKVAGALMLGGGVPVEAGGSLVGAAGVSGAPAGAEDDACGRASRPSWTRSPCRPDFADSRGKLPNGRPRWLARVGGHPSSGGNRAQGTLPIVNVFLN